MASSPTAGCAVCAEVSDAAGAIWSTSCFQLRASSAPGVAGWLVLETHAHVAGPAAFSDEEARTLGPALRAASAALLTATGAQRVYVAAMGEAHHHFHMHLVPRYADGPAGWALFGTQAAAVEGRTVVDAARAASISAAVKTALFNVRVD